MQVFLQFLHTSPRVLHDTSKFEILSVHLGSSYLCPEQFHNYITVSWLIYSQSYISAVFQLYSFSHNLMTKHL